MRRLSMLKIVLLAISIILAVIAAVVAALVFYYPKNQLVNLEKPSGNKTNVRSNYPAPNLATPELDGSESTPQPPAEESGSQDSQAPNSTTDSFKTVTNLGSGSLPLRSQRAITTWNQEALIVLTDGSDIVVVEADGKRHKVTTLGRSTGGPTIAANGSRVVVAWVTSTAIMSSSSTDLVTWTTPITVGERKQDGGPIPSIDWTGDEFAVVWVDAPKTNSQTGAMDGIGDLLVASGDGTGSWSTKTLNSTTAMVAISDSTIVWRDDRAAASGNGFDSVRTANIDGSNEAVICSGYDPAISVDGNAIAIGYHLGAEAHLRTTTDGKTWNDVVLDSTGKFVSPFAWGGKFGAVWVDYTDAAAARDARNNSGHRTTAVWDGKEFKMNNGATKTVQGQGEIVSGIPTVVYSIDGTVYLAN